MAINRSSIAKELLPGLNAVFGTEYGEVNDEHKPLYEIENSDNGDLAFKALMRLMDKIDPSYRN